jgi:hypothetical protein
MIPFSNEAVRSANFVKGISPLLRARYQNHQGAPFTSVDVSAITFVAQLGTEQADGSILWASIAAYDEPTTIAVSGNWFDALQGWAEDSVGYNAALPIPADVWDSAVLGRRGGVEVTVTLTSGRKRWQRWESRIVIPV